MDDLENGRAIKSNVFGTGHAHGDTTTAGCSSKGKLWKMDSGTVDQWMRWCELVAAKLADDSIDTAKILRNVMRVEQLRDQWPEGLFFADWPETIGIETEGKWEVTNAAQQFSLTELTLGKPTRESPVILAIPLIAARPDGQEEELLRIQIHLTNDGFRVEAGRATIFGSSTQTRLAEYLHRNPLRLLKVDGSFIVGNYRYFSEQSLNVQLPVDRIKAWDWGGINISNESMKHPADFDTVQGHTFQQIRDQYQVIVNDDGAGEIADLVAIREHDGIIIVDLYHCKYCSAGSTPGARVDDTYVVSGQASRSVKWLSRGNAIFQRLLDRYSKAAGGGNDRLLKGRPEDLEVFKSKSRSLEVRLNFFIVQPAVSLARVSQEMLTVFGSSYIYLKNIADSELCVICSP